jgi:hypothetical protein
VWDYEKSISELKNDFIEQRITPEEFELGIKDLAMKKIDMQKIEENMQKIREVTQKFIDQQNTSKGMQNITDAIYPCK